MNGSKNILLYIFSIASRSFLVHLDDLAHLLSLDENVVLVCSACETALHATCILFCQSE